MITITLTFQNSDFSYISGKGADRVILDLITANPHLYMMAAEQVTVTIDKKKTSNIIVDGKKINREVYTSLPVVRI